MYSCTIYIAFVNVQIVEIRAVPKNVYGVGVDDIIELAAYIAKAGSHHNTRTTPRPQKIMQYTVAYWYALR